MLYKLSSSGNISYGDSVTLLFGKDGKIADVISAADSSEEVIGVLLNTGKVTSINGSTVEAGGKTYLMSDKVVVYKKVGISVYNVMPIRELAENLDKYDVKAFYDKEESRGGRILILIAQ